MDHVTSSEVVVVLGAPVPVGTQGSGDAIFIQTSVVDEALAALRGSDAAVLIMRPPLTPTEAQQALGRVRQQCPQVAILCIVSGAGNEAQLFQEYVDTGQLYYLSRGALADDDIRRIAGAATRHLRECAAGSKPERQSALEPAMRAALRDLNTRLSIQSDLSSATCLVADAARTVLRAESAKCLVYDADTDTLSSDFRATTAVDAESAATGLVGFVVRTGHGVVCDQIGGDGRYDADADSGGRLRGDARFLAVPILTSRGLPQGVMSVTRNAASVAFAASDTDLLHLLAQVAGPSLALLLDERRAERLLESGAAIHRGEAAIFRQEAVDNYADGADDIGEVLRTAPPWLGIAHWLVAILLAITVVALCFLTVRATAMAPAVVQAKSTTPIWAPDSGTVTSIEAQLGDGVRAGSVLAHIAVGDGESDRFSEVRAPMAGTLRYLRLRLGQRVSSGEAIGSIVDKHCGYEIVAFFPAKYQAQVRPGTRVNLRIDGYAQSNEPLTIERVSSAIVPAPEAGQYGLREPMDLGLPGGVVVARLKLSADFFRAAGEVHDYHDGMRGLAEITLRSDRMITNFVPGLKEFTTTR